MQRWNTTELDEGCHKAFEWLIDTYGEEHVTWAGSGMASGGRDYQVYVEEKYENMTWLPPFMWFTLDNGEKIMVELSINKVYLTDDEDDEQEYADPNTTCVTIYCDADQSSNPSLYTYYSNILMTGREVSGKSTGLYLVWNEQPNPLV